MHVFRIFNNGFVLEDTGYYCVGEHAARDIRLCREERDIIWQRKECEYGLI
jgi:hypothetical protein